MRAMDRVRGYAQNQIPVPQFFQAPEDVVLHIQEVQKFFREERDGDLNNPATMQEAISWNDRLSDSISRSNLSEEQIMDIVPFVTGKPYEEMDIGEYQDESYLTEDQLLESRPNSFLKRRPAEQGGGAKRMKFT